LDALHYGFDPDLGRFRVDGIAVTAQSSHSGGSPINQRLCAGFNWPPLSIPAEEPISISPEAVSRAGWFDTLNSTVFRLLSVLPAALYPFCAGVPAIGVGQPANGAVLGKSRGFDPSPELFL
jgi:hypothetical protein